MKNNVIIEIKVDGQTYTVPVKPIIYQEWEKNHGEGSFLELAELVAVDCNRFTEIGKRFSVTREWIRQVYQKCFAEYLPHRNGRARLRVCTIGRVRSRVKYPKPTLAVWNQARKSGLTVEPYYSPVSKSDKILSKYLVINGCHIKIIRSEKRKRTGGTQANYIHFGIGPIIPGDDPIDGYVLVANHSTNPLFFIVPTDALRVFSWFPDKVGGIYLHVLPPDKRVNTPRSIAINERIRCMEIWNYKDAWHLLK